MRFALPVSFSSGQINPEPDNVVAITIYFPGQTQIVQAPEFCVVSTDPSFVSVLCIIPLGTLFGDGKFGYLEIPVILPPKTKDSCLPQYGRCFWMIAYSSNSLTIA